MLFHACSSAIFACLSSIPAIDVLFPHPIEELFPEPLEPPRPVSILVVTLIQKNSLQIYESSSSLDPDLSARAAHVPVAPVKELFLSSSSCINSSYSSRASSIPPTVPSYDPTPSSSTPLISEIISGVINGSCSVSSTGHIVGGVVIVVSPEEGFSLPFPVVGLLPPPPVVSVSSVVSPLPVGVSPRAAGPPPDGRVQSSTKPRSRVPREPLESKRVKAFLAVFGLSAYFISSAKIISLIVLRSSMRSYPEFSFDPSVNNPIDAANSILFCVSVIFFMSFE
jgi:hypothetical protein